jgi:Glycosyl transferase family 2
MLPTLPVREPDELSRPVGFNGAAERGTTSHHIAGAVGPPDDEYDVDVVILSLDRAEETIAAIRSVRAQTGVSRHVFIVDQGSRPENLARLAAEVAGRQDVTLLALDRNHGVAGGRNGVLRQTLRALPAAIQLSCGVAVQCHSPAARRYLLRNDTAYRGRWISTLWHACQDGFCSAQPILRRIHWYDGPSGVRPRTIG